MSIGLKPDKKLHIHMPAIAYSSLFPYIHIIFYFLALFA